MSLIVNLVLLVFLLVMALAVLRTTHLFAMAMMFSLYSLLVAGLFVVLDAPDVAFTEAAVGTGISTVLMLVTLAAVKDGHEAPKKTKNRAGPMLICVVMGGLLIFGTHDIAKLGDINSAPNQQVALRYVEQGQSETGVPNLVTAVLASYRGFDTLGEVTVVLTAGIGVLMLLGPRRKIVVKARGVQKMINDLILRVVTKWLSPTIILFALYVQFHGDYSPGGGFQAGVIFSSAILLYALTYGLDAALKVIPETALKVCASFGVLLYAGVGVLSMLLGGNFLDYSVLASNPLTGQHIGIIVIELGVGITVASVMILLFFTFSRRVAPE